MPALPTWLKFIRRVFLFLVLGSLLGSTIGWATKQPESRWRRTTDGWVSNLQWEGQQSKLDPPAITDVHPTLVASFQVLFSIGGLLYFDRRATKKAQPITLRQ